VTTTRRAVSIEDIAREAGVSHATVSRALHDSPLISGEVRQQIQELARAMGYTPNAVAQSLKGQRTHTIGLIVTSIADPFYGRLARGVEDVAKRAGMDMFLGVSGNDADQEMLVFDSFRRRRVDGVITASSRLTDEQIEQLADVGLPTVLMNRQSEGESQALHSVSVDDELGAHLAVRHLLGLGHRAIGYLGSGVRPRANRRRRQAYCDALLAAGITPQDTWLLETGAESAIVPALAPGIAMVQGLGAEAVGPDDGASPAPTVSDDVEDGRLLALAALQAGVTALFCCNDMYAVGALLSCRELGVRVPEQLSIVGFDGVEISRYVTPPLTTVHQPKLRLGQLAMDMLLRLMEGQPVENQVVAPELVVRASSGPAPVEPLRLAAKEIS
jgi:DNA-binding LacI/PurR family transcriptional regulator